MFDNKPPVGSYEDLRHGSKWLGAARSWLQYHRHAPGNGESIIWGSDEEIKAPLTMKELEEIALDVAVAAIEEYKEKLKTAAVTKELLQRHQVERITEFGPDRVVFSGDGEATTPKRAREEYNVIPTVIFIRKDGWSLGAPEEFRRVAHDLWGDEWVMVMTWDGTKWLTRSVAPGDNQESTDL